jgi:hypothetical protein
LEFLRGWGDSLGCRAQARPVFENLCVFQVGYARYCAEVQFVNGGEVGAFVEAEFQNTTPWADKPGLTSLG